MVGILPPMNVGGAFNWLVFSTGLIAGYAILMGPMSNIASNLRSSESNGASTLGV
jgi:hypothetical protein